MRRSQHLQQVDRLLALCVVALGAGVIAGFLGAMFRICLTAADDFRLHVIEYSQQWEYLGWLVPLVIAAIAVAIARLLVVYVPAAKGSGVQRVEASVRSQVEPDKLNVVPVKFFGGILAIGSGLVLGREGPTVQMAAAVGSKCARMCKFDSGDINSMQAALAGAGLGVAFNAPLGGAIFVVEELTKSVALRLVTVTLLATASAIATMRLIIGSALDFDVPTLSAPTATDLVGFLVLGLIIGLLGAFYNKTVIFFLDAFDYFGKIPLLVRAGIVGGFVGVVGWFAPSVVGGGDNLTQQMLLGSGTVGLVFLILVARWLLGPLSYSTGTPGGLFAPLLVLGAAVGSLLAAGINAIPSLEADVSAFALVGMAAFFTAVVRAPLTGIALVVEMTAVTSQLVPMLLACAVAVVVTLIVRSEPIYDTLRHRLLAERHPIVAT